MRDMMVKPEIPPPLHPRAGAVSVLCGIAALQSAQTGTTVRLDSLLPEIFA